MAENQSINGNTAIAEKEVLQTLDFGWVGKKLYGRSAQVEELYQIYKSSMSSNNNKGEEVSSSFVLISGSESGTGTTALARTLKDIALKDGRRNIFLTGKFDLLQRAEPYPAFRSAFTEFVTFILAEGHESVQKINERINKELEESEIRILVDMIPALLTILTVKDESISVVDAHRTTRFASVLRSFLRSICSPKRPIVVLLDDLHWADLSSLDLVVSIVSEMKNILFVATLRLDAMSSKRINDLTGQLEADNITVFNIQVDNLPLNVVSEGILSDGFGLDSETSRGLSGVLYERTHGNPLFTFEMLRVLLAENLLSYNQRKRKWQWTERREIDLTIECRQMECLAREKFGRISRPVQELLQIASCLGSTLQEEILGHEVSIPVSNCLVEAEKSGLITRSEKPGEYAFSHDIFQSVAYSLISEELRSTFHFTIGRKLLERLSSDELERDIYVVLHQFIQGSSVLKSQSDRYRVSALTLKAGRKAVYASSFPTAWTYLKFGKELLGENCWEEKYALSLALYNAAAEVAVRTEPDQVDALLGAVFQNGRGLIDKLQAHATKIHALGAKDEIDEAVYYGLYVLRQLGEIIPSNPNKIQIIVEYARTRRLLHRKTNEAILRLPTVTDRNKLFVMQFLNTLFLYSFMASSNLAPMLPLRLVQLTMKHGLSTFAAFAFSVYGNIVSLDNAREGYRYGQLSLVLLKKFNARVWTARVYLPLYGQMYCWTRPREETAAPLKYAYQVGMETGDIEFALLCRANRCFQLYFMGRPLGPIEAEVIALLQVMKSHKQKHVQILIASFMKTIQSFLGRRIDRRQTVAGYSLRFDSSDLQDTIDKKDAVAFWSDFHRMIAAYMFQQYEEAVEIGKFCSGESFRIVPGVEKSIALTFHALSLLALYQRSGRRRRKTFGTVRGYIRHMQKLAALSPRNVLCNLFLVQAELGAVTKCKYVDYNYTAAIAMATETSNLFELALCCERAGKYAFVRDDKQAATSYLRRAVVSYTQWGTESSPIVRQLLEEYDFLSKPAGDDKSLIPS